MELVDLASHRANTDIQEIVGHLEDFIKQAKDGRIESFAIVLRRPNGDLNIFSTTTADTHHLLAGLRYLEHQMIDYAIN